MTATLVTGSGSGLGRYLHERLGGIGITRQTPPSEWDAVKREGADVIVHCAANSRRAVDRDALVQYLDDNLFLTQRLVSIPHRRFVYLSSVDVYEKTAAPHCEDEIITADRISGLYGMTKFMSEAIVAAQARDPLILRASGLLGVHSRPNNLIRMIEQQPCTLTLSADSSLNYVLHEDIADFIALAVANGVLGTYNAVSSQNVTLQEIVDFLRTPIPFGSYRYDAGSIDNSRIAALCPAFARGSLDTVKLFVSTRQHT